MSLFMLYDLFFVGIIIAGPQSGNHFLKMFPFQNMQLDILIRLTPMWAQRASYLVQKIGKQSNIIAIIAFSQLVILF